MSGTCTRRGNAAPCHPASRAVACAAHPCFPTRRTVQRHWSHGHARERQRCERTPRPVGLLLQQRFVHKVRVWWGEGGHVGVWAKGGYCACVVGGDLSGPLGDHSCPPPPPPPPPPPRPVQLRHPLALVPRHFLRLLCRIECVLQRTGSRPEHRLPPCRWVGGRVGEQMRASPGHESQCRTHSCTWAEQVGGWERVRVHRQGTSYMWHTPVFQQFDCLCAHKAHRGTRGGRGRPIRC